jgi:hypothetical protein
MYINCNRFSLIYQYTKFNPTTYKNNHQYNKKIIKRSSSLEIITQKLLSLETYKITIMETKLDFTAFLRKISKDDAEGTINCEI